MVADITDASVVEDQKSLDELYAFVKNDNFTDSISDQTLHILSDKVYSVVSM
jgi:hypothetical protein